ncbi:MAG: peptide deformylase [Patescibacteria group bacterium]
MLDIVIHPNENLRKRSVEINSEFLLSSDTQKLIQEMIPTMKLKDGVGLAAPQIGKNIRICVIAKEALQKDEKTNYNKKQNDLILINPIWEKTSRKKNIDTEGCLSVPGFFGEVRRYSDIIVKALNEHGESLEFDAHDYFARVIQHEVDHLDGILFIDKAQKIFQEK